MRVRFWGTRGSIATPGKTTVYFGGNTSCVEVVTDAGGRLILDCGTGARLLGNHLLAKASGPISGSILLTHTHWDHIQGFPFFAPLFIPGNTFEVFGPEGCHTSLSPGPQSRRRV
jgi:phosphoribosyl 1,2-cyclic phosphodiesterase